MPRPTKQPAASSATSSGKGLGSFSSDGRLPVNPRRKKVAPEQRKRVATACNSCNVRRIKCSGDRPCRQCTSASRDCVYPPPVEKVSLPKSELDELLAMRRRYDYLEQLLKRNNIPLSHVAPSPGPSSPQGPGSPSASSPVDDVAMVDVEMPQEREHGKLLTDNDGTERYLGETSGANYLDAIREFVVITHRKLQRPLSSTEGFLASRGRYQTFDSRPLDLPAVDPLLLPSTAEMTQMLSNLSLYIQDGNGSFPCGGLFFWPFKDVGSISAESVPTSSSGGPATKTATTRQLAMYHMGFAFASLIGGQPSEQFFSRARRLLGNPLDITLYTLDDVPALALMTLYLVENNRRDAAYMCISNAVHVSIMHGIHRSPAFSEERRRTFWTVYILDRWLSCLMGRPPTIPDDAITLPMPEETPGMPSPVGLYWHVQLSRISDYIVTRSYQGQQHDYPERAIQLLADWEAELPPELRLPTQPIKADANIGKEYDQAGCVDYLGNDRARCSLHMSFYQLAILTVRPAFLAAVKKLAAERWINHRSLAIENHPQVQWFRWCADAARNNLLIGEYIKSHWNKLLVTDLHHIFNAAVVLLLHRISFLNWRTSDLSLLAEAKRVFEEEAASGNGYAKDCVSVLTDLYNLVEGLDGVIFSDKYDEMLSRLQGDMEVVPHSMATSPPQQEMRLSSESPTSPPVAAFVEDGGAAEQDGGEKREGAFWERLVSWQNDDDMELYGQFPDFEHSPWALLS
ncbi:fungal-specific transcription factor domain-containing protein [Apodospora peruviana]|uniref:Fungal-specific transcription factor domain-containing protein n=1 Tax=Apodospora peruviana TaxID=516989 RepID=A0AAE0I083_9PEZI|nr:fungal-specific transcription factor domain-containing protein [Apodospora peruviana]